MYDPSIPASVLGRKLRSFDGADIRIDQQQIRYHRRGDCNYCNALTAKAVAA